MSKLYLALDQCADDPLSWDNPADQFWRYFADRTGIISFANLPLVWLFAGRNDVLMWLTGWSFSTFNVFHRYSARIATVQGILHSIAYTIIYYRSMSLYGVLLEHPLIVCARFRRLERLQH